MLGKAYSRLVNHQSELSAALAIMFASGGLFSLLVATVLPPERPAPWYLPFTVSSITLIIACVVFAIGRRITLKYAAWISSIYLLLLILLVVAASKLSRATVTGMMVVVVIMLLAWFMPMWYTRLVGYTGLGVIAVIMLIRFPTNDGILTVVALVSLSILLTEVFVNFKRGLQRSSLTDHLTGAWNRAGFERLLDAQIRAQQRTGEPLSVIYIDLDDFKLVNDRLGHGRGDEVLRQVAADLTAGLRASDSVTRVGGDEFVLLLPSTGEEAAHALCRRLQGTVTACGWSYGVAEYRPGESPEAFVKRSDAAMLQIKRWHGEVKSDVQGGIGGDAGGSVSRER